MTQFTIWERKFQLSIYYSKWDIDVEKIKVENAILYSRPCRMYFPLSFFIIFISMYVIINWVFKYVSCILTLLTAFQSSMTWHLLIHISKTTHVNQPNKTLNESHLSLQIYVRKYEVKTRFTFMLREPFLCYVLLKPLVVVNRTRTGGQVLSCNWNVGKGLPS